MEATPLWGTTTTPSLKHGTLSQDEETNGGMFGRRTTNGRRFPELKQHLWELSDPSHPRYGVHLSKEEADTLMAPHPEALDIVNGWLASHGLVEESLIRSSANDWVTIRTYYIYKHAKTGESIVRTTSYSLPEILHNVDLIQPTTLFARFKAFKSTLHWANQAQPPVLSTSTGTITGPAGNQVDASCNSSVTISCLKQLYNSEAYKTSAMNSNKLGLTDYLGQYTNNMDLQQFYQLENPSAYGSNYTFVSMNGGLNNQIDAAAGIEANLDIVLPQPILPQTISTSYGDDEQTVPFTYASRVCASILFSSGDFGVGDGDANPTTQTCYSNDGLNIQNFLPNFPASCPYVTTMGGTVNIPETAVFFSGSGFSDYFVRPAYQEVAVSEYLAKLAPGTYEARAMYFAVIYQGQTIPVAGTSCSSPTFASFVSMLNDACLNVGKSPLGFLNSFLYSSGYTALNDITAGNNPGFGTQGFNVCHIYMPSSHQHSPYVSADPTHHMSSSL
ncbi:tripeptidyl peptidase A [Suillus occidentalis]|nr:tripeptidyl peptidase A [Suillus occidentalis]